MQWSFVWDDVGEAGGRSWHGRRGCVGVVRGAGRRGSVACGVAQSALLCAFMFVLMSFLYFTSYFVCILAFLYLYACVLPYMA